jgi:hypothetical protein
VAYTQIDKDIKTFLDSTVNDIIENIEVRHEDLLPEKSEFFVTRFLKDSKGILVKNEPVHNIMHRFIRLARSKGYNKFLCLGAFGHGKSICKGNQVLMYDLTMKKIEDVIIGDLLMGPDSKPRKVLDIGIGKEQAYRITLKNKDSFECNESHKMPFYISNRWNGYQMGDVYVGTIKEYLALPKWAKKNCWKIQKAQLDFPEQKTFFDPYFLGLWYGDGHLTGLHFTINDEDVEIIDYLYKWSNENDFIVRKDNQKGNCHRYDLTKGTVNNKTYPELEHIRKCVVGGEKRIHKKYLRNSRNIRLELLAGMLDTDGYLTDNCFEWSTKYIGLRDDFLFLCRSLGFSVSHRTKYVNDVPYYVVIVSGHTHLIPCKTRKKASERQQVKNPLVYGFYVEDIGEQEYYGIVLDGDHLYLQDDLTIHHNTEQLATGFALHEIAKNPNILIKLVHVSDTEAIKRCRALRDYIQKDDDVHMIAPHLSPTSIWGSQRFIVKRSAMSKDGTVEAYGILSTAIGGRANLIIFDDPQDLKTAVLEPTTRQKIEDVFKNIWLTRLIPDESEVLVMMNKWHNNDLASLMQRNPIWAWMSIAVTEDLNNLQYKDSFGREFLLPLWSKFNRAALLMKKRELGERDFNRGYRLIPYTDSDKTFPSFWNCCQFGVMPDQFIDDEKNWIFVSGIDFAGTQRPGTILSTLAVHRKTGLKLPIEIVSLRGSSELPTNMVRLYRKYGVELFMAENNGVQDALIDMLISMLGEDKFKRYNLKIQGFLTGRNKADPLQGLPSMEKEMANKEWLFCADKKPDITDIEADNPWMKMFYEFGNHPFYDTTDIVMSLWFCREGVKSIMRGSTGPNCW